MSKSIEDYLSILYPNRDSLSDDEQKRFEKDKTFILEFFEEFNAEYNKYYGRIDEFGEFRFTSTILQMCKERLDKETIITSYVQKMYKVLNKNPYISNNFEAFMNLMYYERKQEEQLKDTPLDKTPIDLQTVFALTEEYLSEIDQSQELITEFRDLRKQGKILVHSPNDSNNPSVYKNGTVHYSFDGTVNSAHTLLHEFMHHWVEIKAHPNNDFEEHSMLYEYESIYYENAFIQFMNSKGLLKDGEVPLKASRLKREHSKDPNNCVLILLELCQELKNNGTLDKESIIDILEKNIPNTNSRDEIWQKGSELLSQFCEEYSFVQETINVLVMYRFNTGLAMQTSLDQDTTKKIFKLAPLFKSREHDDMFMEHYFNITSRTDKTFSSLAERSSVALPSNEESIAKEQISTLSIGKKTSGVGIEDKLRIGDIFRRWIAQLRGR